MDFQGRRVLIFGLGRSGLAAARALAGHGAQVTLTDKRQAQDLGSYAMEAKAAGFGLALGGHEASLVEDCDLVVLSPGVPSAIPPLQRARQRGLEVWSEIELAYRLARRRWLAVTGTNGKTTCTSLVAAMLERAGGPYLCGGNIGRGLADEVERLDPSGIVLAEVSSFQLEEIHAFRPEVALITNLTPDHLDRYKDMDAYAAAKARIFENQEAGDFLVLNAMDEAVLRLGQASRSRRLHFSRLQAQDRGAWLEDGVIRMRLEQGGALDLMPLSGLRLRGPHNHENALASALMAAAAGLPLQSIVTTLEEFQGVEHRLEYCGEVRGVRFVNDSKATNVDSVEKALQSFQEPVHLILGGRDKEGDFSRLSELVRAHVARLYLIGEAAPKVERQLGQVRPFSHAPSLEDAMRQALDHARKGEWVLLSPGCASFDMFKNYEHRGKVFKEAVARMAASESELGAGHDA
jgi:UDP-N-acetylmuramoylalanine--D-glutamate ligase